MILIIRHLFGLGRTMNQGRRPRLAGPEKLMTDADVEWFQPGNSANRHEATEIAEEKRPEQRCAPIEAGPAGCCLPEIEDQGKQKYEIHYQQHANGGH